MTQFGPTTYWRPKGRKLTHPVHVVVPVPVEDDPVWSSFILTGGQWRPKGRVLPSTLNMWSPCTCGGWPCLMLLPTGGRRVEICHNTLSLQLWRMTKSVPPTHWRLKGRALFLTLYIWCLLYLWRMTQFGPTTHWRPKGRALTHRVHVGLPVPVEDYPVWSSNPLEAEGQGSVPHLVHVVLAVVEYLE